MVSGGKDRDVEADRVDAPGNGFSAADEVSRTSPLGPPPPRGLKDADGLLADALLGPPTAANELAPGLVERVGSDFSGPLAAEAGVARGGASRLRTGAAADA